MLLDIIRAGLHLPGNATRDQALSAWNNAQALKDLVLEEVALVIGEEGSIDEWLKEHGELDLGDGRKVVRAQQWRDWKLRKSPGETLDLVMTGLGGDLDEISSCLSSQPFKPAETAKRMILADSPEGYKPTRKELDEVRERLFFREAVTKPVTTKPVTKGKGKPKPVRKPTTIDRRFT